MSRHYHTIEKALCYLHQHRQSQPSLAELAAHCHLSEFHFQRLFTDWAGVSPKRFLQCLNRDYARACLLQGDAVTCTSDKTGLSSSGRLHDLFVTLEAITPGNIKSGGEGITFITGIHPSPFGDVFIALTERGIHQLAFTDQQHHSLQALQAQWPQATFVKDPSITQSSIEQIFHPSKQKRQALTLWIKGSNFQFKVWEALLTIPQGKLNSYSGIARHIQQPQAARAVGSAVAKNPIAYLIPCHRVIKNLGVLGHYRWGEIRKQAIVGRELSRQIVPVRP